MKYTNFMRKTGNLFPYLHDERREFSARANQQLVRRSRRNMGNVAGGNFLRFSVVDGRALHLVIFARVRTDNRASGNQRGSSTDHYNDVVIMRMHFGAAARREAHEP